MEDANRKCDRYYAENCPFHSSVVPCYHGNNGTLRPDSIDEMYFNHVILRTFISLPPRLCVVTMVADAVQLDSNVTFLDCVNVWRSTDDI